MHAIGAAALLALVLQCVTSLPERPEVPSSLFTPRERDVLTLIAEGLANQAIASQLVVSEAAVAKHIGSIFAKLDLTLDDGHRRVKAVLLYLNT